ncbi:Hypothetical_protein [Hexamita inflata]|uniref:Hypothetical_protein n=1 Tax=Hexamita inflata TaxID=28002 RepID=A0AA86NF52_9EUKA|nr:Hypothetical protein HINF_LOCUS6342 [Hexamita inflata]
MKLNPFSVVAIVFVQSHMLFIFGVVCAPDRDSSGIFIRLKKQPQKQTDTYSLTLINFRFRNILYVIIGIEQYNTTISLAKRLFIDKFLCELEAIYEGKRKLMSIYNCEQN